MLPNVDRSPEELNEALIRRMESMTSDLLVLSGMTKRGAVLPEAYRTREFHAIWMMALRVLRALERGEAVSHPWGQKEKVDAA
jgi:hypothetical protein